MNIFLHRDDLRLHDNRGLFIASEDSETLPVYIDDPRIQSLTGKNKRRFRLESLNELAENYRQRNAAFIYREGRTAEVLQEISEKFEPEKVYFNRSYTPARRSIGEEIRRMPIPTRIVKDRLNVEPQQLSQEFSTFSPFYREWKSLEKDSPVAVPEDFVKGKTERPPEAEDSEADIPEPGEAAGVERWKEFRTNRLENYRDRRDDVSKPEAVSRLSPHYSNGTLSVRKVLNEVNQMIEQEDDSDLIRNYAKYRNELAWREFFYQVLYFNPEVVNQNYRDFSNEINWKNSEEEFRAWKKGETGVPFVDAGMRELRQTGYMHNRLRQNVASFLTKHLMIDWRKGARFFREHLVDHDTASNNGGWQWSASTGTDSVSIRIFNPVKQGRKYDEDADYIKRWIPELRQLEPSEIHNWVEMSSEKRQEIDTDYHEPIIDFNARYHQGKKMFEKALGK